MKEICFMFEEMVKIFDDCIKHLDARGVSSSEFDLVKRIALENAFISSNCSTTYCYSHEDHIKWVYTTSIEENTLKIGLSPIYYDGYPHLSLLKLVVRNEQLRESLSPILTDVEYPLRINEKLGQTVDLLDFLSRLGCDLDVQLTEIYALSSKKSALARLSASIFVSVMSFANKTKHLHFVDKTTNV